MIHLHQNFSLRYDSLVFVEFSLSFLLTLLQILDTNPALYFRLQQQKLIEFIRQGKIAEALDFAQAELAPRGEESPEFLAELEKTDAALRTSEARFRILSEAIPQLVWTAVDEGDWTWASRQWIAFTGQDGAEALHWGWLEPVHPDDRAATRAAWPARARACAACTPCARARTSTG